jgi:voltage-gated potassium channel
VTTTRLARWTDLTDRPLVVAAVLFLAGYALPILDPGLPAWAAVTCRALDVAVWVLFAVDFGVRLALSDQRRRYLLTNWLDVISLVLPMFRPLRVLRAVLALNLLTRRGGAFVRGRVVASVAAAVAVVGFVAALAALDAERSNGYGDRYPTTPQGRLVAGTLMLTGIALLGVVTAELAGQVAALREELRAYRAERVDTPQP